MKKIKKATLLLISILQDNRFYNYVGYRLKRYIKKVSCRVEKGAKILDVGAGQCQYKKYFSQAQYVAQDLCIGDKNWDYSCIDINCEIYDIPVKNDSFDYILCTQVLEHLKYPDQAFKKLNRICVRGGGGICNLPNDLGRTSKTP